MRLAAAALLIPLLTMPQDPPALEKRISIDKTGTFHELLDEIRRSSGANVHLDPRAVLPAPESKVTLTLRDVRTLSALRWLASFGKTDLAVREGIAILGPSSDIRTRLLRSYHTRGLLVGAQNHPGPTLSLPGNAAIGIAVTLHEPEESSNGEEQLVDLIKENVGSGTWEGLNTIERTIDQGGLTVNAHPETHEQLARFLDTLKVFSCAPVSLSAEIVEADDETASLLAPGAPMILAAADIDAVAARIRKARPRLLQTSGLDSQRVHSFHREETSAIVGYLKGEAVSGTWITEAALLDVHPILVGDGRRISVELLLSLGQTRPLEAARTIPGPLPRHERTLIQLATTLLVPNGGGALLALPPRDSASARPQICLLRASTPVAPPTPPSLFPALPASDLIGRLKALPPADIDLADARITDLAAWLRRTSGLNVIAHACEKPVTARFKGIPPAAILDTVLKPLGLGVTARDEALLITTRACIEREDVRITFMPVRDVTYGLQDFPPPSPPPPPLPLGPPPAEAPHQCFTGEDIANHIKNTVHKDSWEEADGKSIQFQDGILIIRNNPDVIRACAAFVENSRRMAPRLISLRADMAVLPADRAEEVLGPADQADATQRERLLAGARVEPLSWVSHEGQRTSLAWSRSLDHVHDYSGEDPILRGHVTSSYLDVTPHLDRDGKTVRLDLRVEDARIDHVKETRVRDGIMIESPVTQTVRAGTTLTIVPDRWAVLRWGLTPKEGEARKTRVLLVRAAPIP